MTEQISRARGIRGAIAVPGDKSISHRYAMLASIAKGSSKIYNYSTGADCHSTLGCMRALGIEHEFATENDTPVLKVHGKGMRGLRQASGVLDAGNSGSTIRMLSGILAAQPFSTTLAGDESLSKRPMRRIMKPLAEMGARIEAANEQFPPLTIHGGPLRAIAYQTPVASAQVKSCVLLAGLYAEGETSVTESIQTRDHTEIALRELGADVRVQPRFVRLRGPVTELHARELAVPGDLSSAAFFLIAALLVPHSELIVSGVGLNPTRTGLLDVLRAMGAAIHVLHLEERNGEMIGTLEARTSMLKGGVIEGATTAAVIDELPILSILGAASETGLTVRDAAELRVKETDRIESIAHNLRAMQIEIETAPEGFYIPGRQRFQPAAIESYGDHRIAMAFSIAGLLADGTTYIHGAEAASVSFPEFYNTLRGIIR
ncbi:MAG TPA: 3-phosphoshikimate 1-carboxyvinyltransferase [Bryobacteraceae bacterium]|jgi:3-phosphoshikimate 1-carboxyvinyltransferase|nr:3-phosphoshikimate 1-carboxyvinyltransferase [Bryobacteraceae bacterium]